MALHADVNNIVTSLLSVLHKQYRVVNIEKK